MKKDIPIVSRYSDTMELPDKTKIKIIVTNYESPLYPHSIPITAQAHIDYVNIRGTRFIGPNWEKHLSEEEAMQHINYVKEKIKENPENYKLQYAPK